MQSDVHDDFGARGTNKASFAGSDGKFKGKQSNSSAVYSREVAHTRSQTLMKIFTLQSK